MNNNVATWFELPVTDMHRAKSFYQNVLQADFKDEDMNNFQPAVFNAEPGDVSGMLVLGEQYQSSQTGSVVYFDGGEDLSAPLEKSIATWRQRGGAENADKRQRMRLLRAIFG